jgi:hypothetical protein
VSAILASRVELERETILGGIGDAARREHAGTVLDDIVATLQDHEARRPVADALDEVVRTLERVSIILGIAAALGAATGLDVADILGEAP